MLVQDEQIEQTPQEPSPCVHQERDYSQYPEGRLARYQRRDVEIRRQDSDCDGKLQWAELEAGLEDKFKLLDKDENEALSEQETQGLLEYHANDLEEVGKGLRERKLRKVENRIKNLDRNDDDLITLEEYKRYYMRRYEKLDDNGDKVLEINEFKHETERSRNRRNDRDGSSD